MEIVRANKTAKAVLKTICEAGEAALPDGRVIFTGEQLIPTDLDGNYEYTLRFRIDTPTPSMP